MKTSDFDFDLPDELVAQHPVEPRDASRLMVVRLATGKIEHATFAALPDLLRATDLLVRNNTKVVPARVYGARESTGGRWEGLFLRECEGGGRWEMLAKTRGRTAAGESIRVAPDFTLRLVERTETGSWIVEPSVAEASHALLERYGQVPLPPYIRKGIEAAGDRARYQTVYAGPPGSVAAPTAGLHFTPELLERLKSKGIESVDVTLHVGLGTFRPIEAETIEAHALHAERGEVSVSAAERIQKHKSDGGRIVAVGTTSVRTLETAGRNGRIEAFSGETALYIQPGHRFQVVDAIVTNFHLPKSSLLVLVAAFAGYDLMREAYRVAVAEKYRFYSYGDAMLILPE